MSRKVKVVSLRPLPPALAARKSPSLNGLPVIADTGTGWRFIPLPRHMWQSTHEPCDCPHCKGAVGYMDTLVVPSEGTTLFIHFPEVHPARKESV